jgi:hypothetical protein
MLDEYLKNVPIKETCVFHGKLKQLQRTTESRIGKKIVAVLIFDVTSVKRPLIIITNKTTAVRDIPAKNRSACATLFDKFDTLLNKEKTSLFLLNQQT